MSREWGGSHHGRIPVNLMMEVPGLSDTDAQRLAQEAVRLAQLIAPKSSGQSARDLYPVWAEGRFGIGWRSDHVWFQEMGIRPFTMRNLAGKTIPMWIDDPTGRERAKNPKARTRVSASGKTQVLIFRKAAAVGERKNVTRTVEGRLQTVSVPRSYPGAPGRIANREARRPWTSEGRVGGVIARRNVGVRWRHPGIMGRQFLRHSINSAALYYGYRPGVVRDSNGRYR